MKLLNMGMVEERKLMDYGVRDYIVDCVWWDEVVVEIEGIWVINE